VRELAGKTAVVSAAASGIGRALALALAAEGMAVALLDIRREAVDAVRAEMPAGATARAYAFDVGERESVRAVAAAVERDFGGVDLLCSNVGVIFTGQPLYETPDEMFDWMLNVNVTGTFNTIKAFVPGMLRRGRGGQVTITSSSAGLHVIRGAEFGAYVASKMAVVGLAEDLRQSLAPHGIGVSAVVPGRVRTNAANSGRQRPARFGGPFDRENPPAMIPDALSPEEAARIIVRGIRENAPYVFTRPIDRANVEARFAAMLADFDRWERALPELGITKGTRAD
jgi:NAD(P)-dependent dehydrogenase (short-subunit alcohol dehydrogenase family)